MTCGQEPFSSFLQGRYTISTMRKAIKEWQYACVWTL